jgi:putative transposase
MNELRFFNPYVGIRHTENRLPHWQQKSATYFVTFRLADSIPSPVLGQWQDEREAWLHLHPEPWNFETEIEYHQRFSGAIERWLDQGHGACLLRLHDCAEIEGERLVLISAVVMPNHVHTLFIQNPEWPLEKLIRSWKGFTARQINKLFGRTGSLWQRDYFDRLIRDEEHFGNCVRYIRRNPERARLKADEFVLWESEIARKIY